MLFISIPTSQGMPTNIIESSHELSDKDFFCWIIILLQSLVIYNYNLVTSTWVCSIRILSSVGGYYPAPLALLLLFSTAIHAVIYDMLRYVICWPCWINSFDSQKKPHTFGIFNSLWPSYPLWRHRSGHQAITWTKCGLIIKCALGHALQSHFTRRVQGFNR